MIKKCELKYRSNKTLLKRKGDGERREGRGGEMGAGRREHERV